MSEAEHGIAMPETESGLDADMPFALPLEVFLATTDEELASGRISGETTALLVQHEARRPASNGSRISGEPITYSDEFCARFKAFWDQLELEPIAEPWRAYGERATLAQVETELADCERNLGRLIAQACDHFERTGELLTLHGFAEEKAHLGFWRGRKATFQAHQDRSDELLGEPDHRDDRGEPDDGAGAEPDPDGEPDPWGPSALAGDDAVNTAEPERRAETDGGWRLPDLDPAALYGIAGEYALMVQPFTEACVAGVLISVLIGFGNAANRNAYTDVGGTRHYVNENALLVGPTGTGRKGEAMNIGLRPIRAANAEWVDCVKRGFGSGEAIVESVRDRVAVLEGDAERIIDEGAKDKRLLLYEDEFSHVITVAGREDSTLSSHIRNAWDSRRLEARTKGKALIATDAHVSVLAGITPTELVRRMPETELANGFLNRFVLVAVDRSQVLPDPPRIPPDFDAEWADRFGAPLAWTRRHGAGHMERDHEARALWDRAYRAELSISRYGLAGAVCSRAEAHVLRLSMIYALLDRSTEIREVHIRAAIALWRYCEASALLVFGDRLGDPAADTILNALHDRGEMTRDQIVNLFSRHKSRAEIDNALSALEAIGRITSATVGTGERPRTVVRIRA